MSELESQVGATVLRLQIVVGALIAGVVTFSTVFLVLVSTGRVEPTYSGRLLYLAVPTLALGCAAAFGIYQTRQREHLERKMSSLSDEQILAAYSNRTIVGTAMAESVALISGIGYLLTASAWMILGIVGAVIVMIGFLPSADKLRDTLQAGKPL